MTGNTIRAVTFDFWDTLVGEHQGQMRSMQIDGWLQILGTVDIEIPRGDLVSAFNENWTEFERRWSTNAGQHTAADATDLICLRLGIAQRAEDAGIRDDLIASFRDVGERAPLTPAADLAATLAALKGAGIRLGIVCDVGLTSSPTLRLRLERFGLLGFFDAWAFSDETGWFKPAREAFAPALEGLGVGPEDSAHVGDSPRTDVAGALALGMTAIRYLGFVDRAPPDGQDASLLARSHSQIPGLLGL
jgi:putative hydrolase of the HAD superfamily